MGHPQNQLFDDEAEEFLFAGAEEKGRGLRAVDIPPERFSAIGRVSLDGVTYPLRMRPVKSRRIAISLGWAVLLLLLLGVSPLIAGDTVVFTIVGRIQFSVPSDWVVISSKSDPTLTLFAFKIKNAADEGTSDPTNLVIISYYLKDHGAKAAFKEKLSDQKQKAQKKESVDNWNCISFSAMQGSTQYHVWDCTRKVNECGVFVRVAWPELPKNPPDYDKIIEAALTDVLKSIAPAAK